MLAYYGGSIRVGEEWVQHPQAIGDNWDEVIELLDSSFRLTAPRRLIDELDAK